MLYFHRGFDGNDVIDLLKIFTAHKFGHNRFGDKVDTSLVDSIGHLEAVLIVYLLDLPALTETIEDVADLDRHPIWKNSSLVQDLDKNIGSNLGKSIFEITLRTKFEQNKISGTSPLAKVDKRVPKCLILLLGPYISLKNIILTTKTYLHVSDRYFTYI